MVYITGMHTPLFKKFRQPLVAVTGICSLWLAACGNPASNNDTTAITEPVPGICGGGSAFIPEGPAPVLPGLGSLQFPVTTASAEAQRFFNQGLTLIYAFNFPEAARSFREVTRRDPRCAMGYWGLALAIGPNYNAGLDTSVLASVNEYLDTAHALSQGLPAVERGLIAALRQRFPRRPVDDLAPLYENYAVAMRQLHREHPDHADVAALYADALMNQHPWDLWLKDGTAQPWTPAIVQVLESAMRRHPDHPGILHLYLHAMEASREATRALPAADKLGNLLPAAGHIVHMPSHIYIRTGHYQKGVLANERAELADSNYVTQCRVQGIYPLLYYPHGVHFLASCALLQGNTAKAIAAGDRVRRLAENAELQTSATVQHYYSIAWLTRVVAGAWDDILRMPAPDTALTYPTGIWLYARGMAEAATGQLPQARATLGRLQKIAADPALDTWLVWDLNAAGTLVKIARDMLQGEIAWQSGNTDGAIKAWRQALALEETLNYDEPPTWMPGVRTSLGMALLKAGRAAEAEQVYRDDLLNLPENGYSLRGLELSLRAQGRNEEAAAVAARLQQAWQWADITLQQSRYYGGQRQGM